MPETLHAAVLDGQIWAGVQDALQRELANDAVDLIVEPMIYALQSRDASFQPRLWLAEARRPRRPGCRALLDQPISKRSQGSYGECRPHDAFKALASSRTEEMRSVVSPNDDFAWRF